MGLGQPVREVDRCRGWPGLVLHKLETTRPAGQVGSKLLSLSVKRAELSVSDIGWGKELGVVRTRYDTTRQNMKIL